MGDLRSAQVINSEPFPAQLWGDPRSYTKDWVNTGGSTVRVWRAQLWMGMDIRGRGDLWGTVSRISDGSPLLVTNWDRYAEPTNVHNLEADYAPNWFDVAPGDGLRLTYGCRAFLISRLFTIAITLGLLPMRGHEAVTIFYTEEATVPRDTGETMKCHTRVLKNRKLFAKAHPSAAAKLFAGTVHFVQVNFGASVVSSTDMATAMQYATSAASPIAAYCSAYGPCALSVDPNVVSGVVMPTGSTYSDADLQKVVDAVASQYGFPPGDAVVVLSPQDATNTDAPVGQGVLGYHGFTGKYAYSFVNLLGSGLTLGDADRLYAVALSHELAEMTVDPAADDSNPEVCDPCAGNCGLTYYQSFAQDGAYLGGGLTPASGYAFFINSVCLPANVAQCPPDGSACTYAPPGSSAPPPPPPSPPVPWWVWVVAAVVVVAVIAVVVLLG